MGPMVEYTEKCHTGIKQMGNPLAHAAVYCSERPRRTLKFCMAQQTITMSKVKLIMCVIVLAVCCVAAVCVLVSALDFTQQGLKPQQQVQQSGWSITSSSSSNRNGTENTGFRGTGWACFSMAALYMLTGMSGLSQYALPTNPGQAFKMSDIATRHKIWDYWGYGDVAMRV